MAREVKQVIVIRRDLKMRRGKEIAQGAHASIAFVSHKIQEIANGIRCADSYFRYGDFYLWDFLGMDGPIKEWFRGHFTKITCQVGSEKELMDIHAKAKGVGLEVHLVTDSGKTEFDGVPTLTCLAIGPDYSDRIDPVTRHLKLY